MSSDRSTRLPLTGYQLTLRMPKSVHDRHGRGQAHDHHDRGDRSAAALDQAGIDLGASDRPSPLSSLAGAGRHDDPRWPVTTTRPATTEAVIEYKTIEKTDANADPGSRTVQTKGVTGLQQVTTVHDVRRRQADQLEGHQAGRGEEAGGRGRRAPGRRRRPPRPLSPPVAQPPGAADFPTTGGLELVRAGAVRVGAEPERGTTRPGRTTGSTSSTRRTWQATAAAGPRSASRSPSRPGWPTTSTRLEDGTLAGLRQEPLRPGARPGRTRGTTVTA
jgi:hypothetical protein